MPQHSYKVRLTRTITTVQQSTRNIVAPSEEEARRLAALSPNDFYWDNANIQETSRPTVEEIEDLGVQWTEADAATKKQLFRDMLLQHFPNIQTVVCQYSGNNGRNVITSHELLDSDGVPVRNRNRILETTVMITSTEDNMHHLMSQLVNECVDAVAGQQWWRGHGGRGEFRLNVAPNTVRVNHRQFVVTEEQNNSDL